MKHVICIFKEVLNFSGSYIYTKIEKLFQHTDIFEHKTIIFQNCYCGIIFYTIGYIYQNYTVLFYFSISKRRITHFHFDQILIVQN